MANDDWYKNLSWNYQTEAEFETRLQRAHDPHNRALYIRTQAGYLLEAADELTQSSGIQLTKRLFKEYPAEQSAIVLAQEQLADYYFKKGNYALAENYYSFLIDYYNKYSRAGTSGIADVKLVDCLLRTTQTTKYAEAYALLTVNFKKSDGNLILNDHKFYYAEVLATLCEKMGKKAEAKKHAKEALDLAKITDPQFRQKTLGLIYIRDDQFREMQRIAEM